MDARGLAGSDQFAEIGKPIRYEYQQVGTEINTDPAGFFLA